MGLQFGIKANVVFLYIQIQNLICHLINGGVAVGHTGTFPAGRYTIIKNHNNTDTIFVVCVLTHLYGSFCLV